MQMYGFIYPAMAGNLEPNPENPTITQKDLAEEIRISPGTIIG